MQSNKITTGSVLIAFGIIYGDIGTSPLYALKAVIGTKQITEDLVYGGVSSIFWTLLIQTTIKYVWLTLKADNQGEGGIFSLYALVKKYNKKLTIFALIGATALLADGILTPPISVSSAIEGLGNVEGLNTIFVPGSKITIAVIIIILSLLFVFQHFGTHTIGKYFGKIMSVWFSMLFIVGFYNIFHHIEILKSLNPYYAYKLLVEYPGGFWILSAVFLCTTGAEALYSDLGHCGLKNIRISWFFVKISLLTNYLGQAAWLLHQPSQYLDGKNPFFGMTPEWFLLPSIIIATLAAIIASQALISGSFSLINEAINLNFWPKVAVSQPSESKGQLYIPSINKLLWIGCVIVVLYFQSSENMEGIYGFFITITMLMTTVLLTFFLLYKKKWNKVFVYSIISIFFTIEITFFISNLIKLKDNYIMLFCAIIIFVIMYTWWYAKKINNKLIHFVKLNDHLKMMSELGADYNIPKFSTHLIYITKANLFYEIEEEIIHSIFSKKPKRADVYWFLKIYRTNEPYTLNYTVKKLVNDTVIKVNINIGFKIQPRTELYFKKVVKDLVKSEELKLKITPDGSTKYNPEPDFKFITIEKFLSVENEFKLKEDFFLNIYFMLKKISQKDEDTFGLDKDDLIKEYKPLIYSPIENITLTRHYND